jgi:hypothetical protein
MKIKLENEMRELDVEETGIIGGGKNFPIPIIIPEGGAAGAFLWNHGYAYNALPPGI